MNNEGEKEKEEEEEDEFDFDPDFFHIDEDDNMKEDFLYVVKKSLIIEEWRSRRMVLEKRRRIRAKDQDFSGIGGILAQNFRKQLG